MKPAVLAYVAGAVVGAWRTDGSFATRLVHALLWPVGPIAFVVTVAGLLAASLIAFPRAAIAALAGAGLLWWGMAG